MILLNINEGINKDLLTDDTVDFEDFTNNKNMTLKLTNDYDNYDNIDCELIRDIIETNNIKKGSKFEIKCKIVDFLGAGSYGKVFKIKIKNKYYALKINENEIPLNLKARYESLINIPKLNKYIIKIFIAGNTNLTKYKYFSIMEYGGKNLKSQIPFETTDEINFILRQLYNIVYLCEKQRLYLTDFKFNNIVLNKKDYRLKLIDFYLKCESYQPCKKCGIVKTYSTLEIDRIKGILDDENYDHKYQYIPLGVGLIDLLCVKSFSNIISTLNSNFDIDLSLKQTIPLIQLSIYNYEHDSNSLVRDEYYPIYKIKKKIETKFPIVKNIEFYKYFMNLIEVKENYKKSINSKKLQKIIHNLFNAYPDGRTLNLLKEHIMKYM